MLVARGIGVQIGFRIRLLKLIGELPELVARQTEDSNSPSGDGRGTEIGANATVAWNSALRRTVTLHLRIRIRRRSPV